MRKIAVYIGIVLILVSCTKKWDDHYMEDVKNDNVSPMTLQEYFESESDYSDFYNLLKENGMAKELGKDQLLTVWAVKNENFDLSVVGNISHDLVAAYHLNYLELGESDFYDGMRVQALNGIYLTINQHDGENFVNSTQIISTRKFKNGVVHEIKSVLKPLTNMFDFIKLLPDDYSIIRDSITSYDKMLFDRKNSVPTGVDATGNTVYDSVFYSYNPLFEQADFSSEFSQFTLFLPSNEVISGAFDKLKKQYQLMGRDFTTADTVLAIDWIRQAIFQQGEINNYGSQLDLISPFGKVWRTTIQQVDVTNPQQLSNGVVYDVTNLKIPNNQIIDRIKSLVHYYEYLTPEQQQELYTIKGAVDYKIVKGDESPVSGFYYWLFEATGDPDSNDEFSVEFTPLDYNEATGNVSIVKVPPGEYNLYMGFRSKGHPYVDIYFHPGPDPIPEDTPPVATEIPAANSTPWNYDRVNETDPNIRKWNGLGGLVGVVNIPGDQMSTFRIKVKFNKLQAIGAAKKMQIYHWTLKPTANNY